MKIFLIGLSGTGKSSIGKQLASRLKVNFMDTDAIIEKSKEKSISEIFKNDGESYFRKLELEFLQELANKPELDGVVATGGGMPCFNDNIARMKELGLLIHFTVPIEILESRLKKSTHRPLLKDNLMENLKSQFNDRNSYYSKADLSVQTENWNAQKMADLLKKLNQIDSIRPT
tara:strand:+ start:2441 stop:2962 length:522 start_codon:yes stop_codon:yes gene_type:complete